jgi:hypothetical protein
VSTAFESTDHNDIPRVFDFWYFVEEEEEEYDRRNKA